ncbi:MAG: VCBS repeat-containing protein [Deltaproteobacteria bacterium]|nr:VCBS repeat-containing protein [Deltaproteobacteria bacterium]
MRRALLAFIAVVISLTSAVSAWAFGLESMTPRLSDYETRVDEDVFLICDSSLNPATVNAGNVFLESRDAGDPVAAGVSLETTNVANDTIVLSPNSNLRFGLPVRVVFDGVEDLGAEEFDGDWPGGYDWFVPNVPLDLARPEYDPANFTGIFVNANVLLGFDPLDPESSSPDEPWRAPGINATGAWKIHTGRPEIIVADIDNGLSSLSNGDLADRLFLNAGELPQPQIGASPCDDWDCNGDGRFSASDYNADPRLAGVAGANVTPADLFDIFTDGVDDDGNGYTDDISGWDFVRNVNTPLGVSQFPEGIHSNLVGSAAAARADNGIGDKPGVCPDCSLMVVRVTDAVLGDMDAMAAGVEYAADMGARVAMIPLGAPDWSERGQEIFSAAHEAGMAIVAASGDEWGFHHIYPAAADDVMAVHAVLPLPPVDIIGDFDLGDIGYTESYCTNYGSHIEITVSTGACSSESVGNAGGLAGLIFSYALERGIDLSAEEVRQIINMTADDVADHCVTFTGGGCKPGWDYTWGYGRANAQRALETLGVPEMDIPEKIPPAVRIVSPRWWDHVNPDVSPVLAIDAQISARGRTVTWDIGIAQSADPRDDEFTQVGSGSTDGIDGPLADVNLEPHLDFSQLREPAEGPFDKTLTLRVRAHYTADDASEVWGEARKTFAVDIDDHATTGLMPGMPIQTGAAGVGSAVLYDMDGDADGRLEIVLATSNTEIQVWKIDDASGEYEMAPGFPVEIPQTTSGVDDGHTGTPVVADLLEDGVPIIVTATYGGKIYAVWPDGTSHAGGPFVPGFPVSADTPPNDSSLAFGHGNVFAASPTLADLDGDGRLDIIAASYDQKLYAWKSVDMEDDGGADPIDGFPVLLRSNAEQVAPEKVCDKQRPEQVLGSPAVVVVDPESDDPDIADFPSIIVGTTETCGGATITSRLYAVYHNGRSHPDGPFLPDWPVMLDAPLGDEMPIPPVTIGNTSSPAVWRDGPALHVGTGNFGWLPQMVTYEDGAVTSVETLSSSFNISVSASGAFGNMNGDEMWYFMPTGGLVNLTDNIFQILSFNVSGWIFGDWGRTFRKRLDDVHFLHNPTIADLDGDGRMEVVASSLGYLVRAWNTDGETPAGWPKYTQNGMQASPVVGDVDGDGLFEVVTHTNEGRIFAWQTTGTACRDTGINAEWWSFHHDEWNTGAYGTDTLPPKVPTDLRVYFTDDPNVFEIVVTAPGDDWGCGTSASYDLRWWTDAPSSMSPETFLTGTASAAPAPILGGEELRFTVTAPDAEAFSLRATDENDLLGWPSPAIVPTDAPPPDDDTDDDTDDDADDDTVDDDTVDDDASDDDAGDDDADDDASSGDTGDDDDDDGCCGC